MAASSLSPWEGCWLTSLIGKRTLRLAQHHPARMCQCQSDPKPFPLRSPCSFVPPKLSGSEQLSFGVLWGTENMSSMVGAAGERSKAKDSEYPRTHLTQGRESLAGERHPEKSCVLGMGKSVSRSHVLSILEGMGQEAVAQGGSSWPLLVVYQLA